MNEQEKEELYLKWNIPKGKTVFALHSRIEEVKNHLSMVEVVNKMPDEYRNKLVFICSGEKSGVGNHMKLLSEELTRQGHKVVVVSSTNDLKLGEGGGKCKVY